MHITDLYSIYHIIIIRDARFGALHQDPVWQMPVLMLIAGRFDVGATAALWRVQERLPSLQTNDGHASLSLKTPCRNDTGVLVSFVLPSSPYQHQQHQHQE